MFPPPRLIFGMRCATGLDFSRHLTTIRIAVVVPHGVEEERERCDSPVNASRTRVKMPDAAVIVNGRDDLDAVVGSDDVGIGRGEREGASASMPSPGRRVDCSTRRRSVLIRLLAMTGRPTTPWRRRRADSGVESFLTVRRSYCHRLPRREVAAASTSESRM